MRLLTFLFLFVLAMTGTAFAFAPSEITFQGQVVENGGGNVPDGNHVITFRFYNVAVGGSPLSSTSMGANVQGGIFSVVLPVALPFDEAYWIGVQYEAEAEMSPRVPFTSVPYAMNVSDEAAVTTLNGNTGTVNLIAGTNVSITPSGNNFIIAATGGVADSDWLVSGLNMTSIPTGNVGIGVNNPESKLQVGGNLTVGTPTQANSFYAHNGSNFSQSQFGGDFEGQGGQWLVKDENGLAFSGLQPDFDGDGGFHWVRNGLLGYAFLVDGSYNADGSPRITMTGTQSAVIYDLGESGDLSARMPNNSISAPEILDEPGIAAINDHGESSYVVEDSYAVVTSRSISVPVSGYLLAMCSMEIDLRHEGLSASYVTAGLSLSPGEVDNNQDLSFYLPGAAATGTYLNPSTPSAVYPVSAGSHTVYVNARKIGTTTSYIWDCQLNLIFIPTNYGAVSLVTGMDKGGQETNRNVSRSLSSGDIANEQGVSAQANDQRIQKEIASMRSELDALKEEMAKGNTNLAPR